jgi:hypothetical protein
MDLRVYRISSLQDEWIVEQNNLVIRASSQHSAIELATIAAKYDGRFGHDAQVLLCTAQGKWTRVWCSQDSAETLAQQRRLPRTMTN